MKVHSEKQALKDDVVQMNARIKRLEQEKLRLLEILSSMQCYTLGVSIGFSTQHYERAVKVLNMLTDEAQQYRY